MVYEGGGKCGGCDDIFLSTNSFRRSPLRLALALGHVDSKTAAWPLEELKGRHRDKEEDAKSVIREKAILEMQNSSCREPGTACVAGEQLRCTSDLDGIGPAAGVGE